MGQSLCSTTTQIKHQIQYNYLQFRYGQDQKQGKIQHDSHIHFKSYLDLQDVIQSATEKLKASKLMYKDPTMPTQKLILKSTAKQKNQKKQIEAQFIRPYKFLNDAEKGRPYKIFQTIDSSRDYIFVKDQVLQYFGVFLCFVADHPKIISELILTQSNSYGLLAVKMIINSKQQIVYLDDYILCTQQGPLFSQPIKNMYLWPNIIQKAWLKVKGFTQKVIQRTSPQQVFQSFFNFPYKKFPLEQYDQGIIKEYLKKYLYKPQKDYGYIVTTKKQPNIHIGISGKKYFYLIGSFVYDNKRMFYLRNPCGRFNFRGQYDQINQDLKMKIREEFKVVTIQQGNFILQQSQFIQQISEFSICYYFPQLKTTSLAIQLENNSQILVQTQIKNSGNVSLCFRQQSNRKSDTKFSPITYQIFNSNNGQIISDRQNTEGCFGLHNAYLFSEVIKKLPASKYLIRLKKKDKKKHYFGIESFLISSSVNDMKFDMKNQQQFSQQFKQNLKKQGKKNLMQSKRNNQSGKKVTINPIQHIVFMVGDLICIYIEYVSQKNQQYKVEISFPQLKNLELIYPELDLKNISVLPKMIGPSNKEQIMIFQKIDLTAQTELGYFELEAF